MSDNRTKYVLGTVIISLAAVFATAAAMPTITEAMSSESVPLGMTAHVIVTAVDPDGTVRYAEADNVILNGGLNVAGAHLFDTSLKPFSKVSFSDDAAVAGGGTQPTGLFVDTGLIETTYLQTDTVATANDCGTATALTCEQLTTPSTLVSATDNAKTQIVSVALGNADGVFISWVDLGIALPVTPGVTSVTVTYKISLTA